MGDENYLLVRIAVLTGEIILVSRVEIARVEGTIQYTLSSCPDRKTQSMVFSTGISVSLNSEDGELIALVHRVEDRSTNPGRIYLVNQVSRKLRGGEMVPVEAYEELEQMQAGSQYKEWLKVLNYIFAASFFGIALGGSPVDYGAAIVTGGALGLVVYAASRTILDDFCASVLGASSLGLSALVMNRWSFSGSNTDIIIISAIVPLLPGIIFTTTVRGTLSGDYSSGATRVLEAIVTALVVTAGVGAGMTLFHQLAGGRGI